MKEQIFIGFICLVAFIGWNCEVLAIRCHLDNGPSQEEVKKVVRTCMNKLDDRKAGGGHHRLSNASDTGDEYYDDDTGESGENSSGNRERGNKNNRKNQNGRQQSSRFKRGYDRQMQQPSDMADFQWRNSQLETTNRWYNQQQQQNNNNNNNNNRKVNSSTNSTDCLTQCFLQEMKMVRKMMLYKPAADSRFLYI